MFYKFRVLISNMLLNERRRLEKLLAMFASELSFVLLFDMSFRGLGKLPIAL